MSVFRQPVFPFQARSRDVLSIRHRSSVFFAASGRCLKLRCGTAARFQVTRYDDAQQVLGDVRFSSVPSQPGYPLISPAVVAAKRGDPSFLRMDPPKHTEHRRMWTPFFAIKRIQEMRPKIQRIIDRAIDEMLARVGLVTCVAARAYHRPLAGDAVQAVQRIIARMSSSSVIAKRHSQLTRRPNKLLKPAPQLASSGSR